MLKSILLGGLIFITALGVWLIGAEILRPLLGPVGDMWFLIMLLFVLVFWMLGGMAREMFADQAKNIERKKE